MLHLKNFTPRKSLGQNFLKNKNIIKKILSVAALTRTEHAVEVGPGVGILTEELIVNAGTVTAIEKDARLYEFLKQKFASCAALHLIHADALRIPPPEDPYCLIANIPYSITSPLLDHYIRDNPDHLPQYAVLLVQDEVARKICAKPPEMNVLALHVQTFGVPKYIARVSKTNFEPQPKVDSAIVRIDFPSPRKKNPVALLERYFENIHRAFSHKRKMLRSTLPVELLKKTGIEPTRRPETLSVDEWSRLAHS